MNGKALAVVDAYRVVIRAVDVTERVVGQRKIKDSGVRKSD